MSAARDQAERALAAATGRSHAVLAGNGTTALWAALAALDLPAGARVVYPDLTCETAVNAAVFAGLTPVFCDVGLATATPTAAQLAATARLLGADAMVPTHLFGRVAPVPAEEERPVLVDAAQTDATAASVQGGAAAILSFGPGKQVDLGEGGALLTDDASLACAVREWLATLPAADAAAESARGQLAVDLVALGRTSTPGSREHAAGRLDLLRRHRLGYLRPPSPALPDALLAALPDMERKRRQRRAIAWLLRDRLATCPGVQAVDLGPDQAPWRLTVQLARDRDAAAAALTAAGIRTSRLFPPVHRLFGEPDADFPVACAVAARLLNLDLDHLGAAPAVAADRAAAALAVASRRELDHVAS
jgi:dTDP-4-amino-4,6-dideoxygalactose transaminase